MIYIPTGAQIISPTGKGVRMDAAGFGNYGARRGKRLHNGMDFECKPGQDIDMPIFGELVREAKPYKNEPYSGVVIKSKYMTLKIFYFLPDKSMIGNVVSQGKVIGKAQDITIKYPKQSMKPHIHLEIVHINPALFMDD
jgi:hypothetical protein